MLPTLTPRSKSLGLEVVQLPKSDRPQFPLKGASALWRLNMHSKKGQNMISSCSQRVRSSVHIPTRGHDSDKEGDQASEVFEREKSSTPLPSTPLRLPPTPLSERHLVKTASSQAQASRRTVYDEEASSDSDSMYVKSVKNRSLPATPTQQKRSSSSVAALPITHAWPATPVRTDRGDANRGVIAFGSSSDWSTSKATSPRTQHQGQGSSDPNHRADQPANHITVSRNKELGLTPTHTIGRDTQHQVSVTARSGAASITVTTTPTIPASTAPPASLSAPSSQLSLRAFPGLFSADGVYTENGHFITSSGTVKTVYRNKAGRKRRNTRGAEVPNTSWSLTDFNGTIAEPKVDGIEPGHAHFHRNRLTDEVDIWVAQTVAPTTWLLCTDRWALNIANPPTHPEDSGLILDTYGQNWTPFYITQGTYTGNRPPNRPGLKKFQRVN